MEIVVLGVGNTLMSDEGVGVRVIEGLLTRANEFPAVEFIDGGTAGLALLTLIEGYDGFIAVDAASLNAPPGSVRTFEGDDMDAFLRTRARSAHDIGLDDLLNAQRIRGLLPERRALVGIQPKRLNLGEALSPPVADALPVAETAVVEVIGRWQGQR
ncbi:MAG: HyaD/HybD family hydrogenase maturation endopeptidase [Rhodospirillales bacterium]|nr:HyaD/HybD family hydrogenase maturation endopeptidase [Rhodospirillales bacterium]